MKHRIFARSELPAGIQSRTSASLVNSTRGFLLSRPEQHCMIMPSAQTVNTGMVHCTGRHPRTPGEAHAPRKSACNKYLKLSLPLEPSTSFFGLLIPTASCTTVALTSRKMQQTKLPLQLLFFLLILLPLASANDQLCEVRRLQNRLAAATSAEACTKRRADAIARAEARLEKARDCRFAGLSFSTYSELRRLCLRRTVLLREVESCRLSCAHAERKLQQARAACVVIGESQSFNRRKCPKVGPPERRIAELRARRCPDGPGRSADELRKALKEAEEDARQALGLPEPVFETLTLDPVGAVPDSVVFVLHGFGQTVEEIRVLADPLIASRQFPRTRFVLPQANRQFNTFFNTTDFSWFDILGNNASSPQPVGEIIQAAKDINDLLVLQRSIYGIDSKRILLLGFSQGGALSVTVYLRHDVGAASIVSGYLPIASTYPEALNPASQNSPVVLLHGEDDELVPVPFARLTRDALRAFGRRVEYIEFPGEMHALTGVRPQIFAKTSQLFRQVLGL